MSSSTYTTTDTSPPATPVNSRQASRKNRKSSNGTGRRLGRSLSGRSSLTTDRDDVLVDSDDESDDAEPTPLIQRLRPRTKSMASEHVSEADIDGEDELTEEEVGEGTSGPSSRLRSKDGTSRARGAKLKAKEALKGGEDSDTDQDMEVDDDVVDVAMAEGKSTDKSWARGLIIRT
jgi:hypothetical protein